MWDGADKKGMLKDENSTEMFSYQETALRVHLNTILAVKNAVDSSLLVWRKEERVVRMEGRCRWNSDGEKKEERGGSKKRKKHSKLKVSSLKSKAQPMTNHSTSYTPTQHDPTVLTFMVAFTLRPHLIVPQFYWWVDCWLIFVSRARGWVDGEESEKREKRISHHLAWINHPK
jgi:hypothetical protein